MFICDGIWLNCPAQVLRCSAWRLKSTNNMQLASIHFYCSLYTLEVTLLGASVSKEAHIFAPASGFCRAVDYEEAVTTGDVIFAVKHFVR